MHDAEMRVEVIESVERLLEIELHWDELYRADPHAHLYLSSDFLYPIAIRVPGRFCVLAAWSDDNRCVGLLPLLVTTKWSKAQHCLVNTLDMLGHVFDADYTGMLCEPAYEVAVCGSLAEIISNMRFGRVVLNYFAGPSTRLAAFIAAFDADTFDHKMNEHFINDGQTNNLICPYVDLPNTFQDYLASLSSNSRQKLRRLLRQFDKDPSLKIRKSRPETYAEDVTVLSKLWFLRHARKKGRKEAQQLVGLLKESIMLGLASGMVYLAILWRDGKPIAAQANYIDKVNRRALFHAAGRDDSVQDLSVGLLLQAHCIRWSIANGLKCYDFTIGDESYKYSLGGVDRKIDSAEVFTRSGRNLGDALHSSCREEALKVLRQFVKQGRDADARAVAQQAAVTWPDIAAEEPICRLLAQ